MLFNLVCIILALSLVIIPFIDTVLLREVHKKHLKERFELWWKKVERYSKIKLAVLCAEKANDFLDFIFGKPLVSKRMLLRCSTLSTCLLLITLSYFGLINKEHFGVTPWKSYRESVDVAVHLIDSLFTESNLVVFRQVNLTNAPPKIDRGINTNFYIININSNFFVADLTTNGIQSMVHVAPIGNGQVTFSYMRHSEMYGPTNNSTNIFGNVIPSTNPIDDLWNDATAIRKRIMNADKTRYIATYSVVYFVVLFSANAFLFILSLGFCRVMLREIVAARRLVSTAALVAVNLVAVFATSCLVLLCFTFLAIPLFWVFLPFLLHMTNDSIPVFIVDIFASSVVLWWASATSAKLVVLIALLPSVFAFFVGLFSLLAIKWKKAFHFLVASILIRCAETSPITLLLTTIVSISGILVFVCKCLHITSDFL